MMRTVVISSSRGRNDDFIPAMRRESAGVVSITAGSVEIGARARGSVLRGDNCAGFVREERRGDVLRGANI